MSSFRESQPLREALARETGRAASLSHHVRTASRPGAGAPIKNDVGSLSQPPFYVLHPDLCPCLCSYPYPYPYLGLSRSIPTTYLFVLAARPSIPFQTCNACKVHDISNVHPLASSRHLPLLLHTPNPRSKNLEL